VIIIVLTKLTGCIVNNMLIAPHLPKILSLISTHPTVSIVAATGSGKSVGVPAAIGSSGAKTFVTVPTRNAAISLAEYQRVLQKASDPNIDANKLVGYAAEGNVNYGPETLIAYVTGGHARRKMLSYFSNGAVLPIDFCDVLMVDEVHSGSIDTTLIISLWVVAAAAQVRVPRLVIASATPVPMIIQPEPIVYTVDVASLPVEFIYLNKDIDIDDHNGLLYTETAKLAAGIHITTPIDTGHILIFAAGTAEVENIAAHLKDLLKAPINGKIATIIPAFSALKQEDIALIYKQTAPNERKIVIATNIAEMSITIENIGHVIDTMIEKRAETSYSGGFRLATHYISKDSAKQRAGRTGRTRPGVCYRMCTLEHYNKLEDHRPPEIERIPIYETVMELLDVGLPPEYVLKGINTQRVTDAMQLLSRLGLITNNNGSVTVTDSGHFAPKFPLSVRNATFLWGWIQAGHPVFPGIIVAALIDCYGPSYFWVPPRLKTQTMKEYDLLLSDYKVQYFFNFMGYNDLDSALFMWNDLTSTIGGIRGSERDIAKWSRKNSINNKKIRELLMIVEQCINASNRLGYNVQIGKFTVKGVMDAARPILVSVYSDSVLIHKRGITYLNSISREEYRLDTRNSLNWFEDAPSPPPGIVALIMAEIKTQRGTFRAVKFAINTYKDAYGREIIDKYRVSQLIPEEDDYTGPPELAPITGLRKDQNDTFLKIQNITHDRFVTSYIGSPGDDARTPPTSPGVNTEETQSEQNLRQAFDLLSTLNLGGPPAQIGIVPKYLGIQHVDAVNPNAMDIDI